MEWLLVLTFILQLYARISILKSQQMMRADGSPDQLMSTSGVRTLPGKTWNFFFLIESPGKS